MADWKMMFDLTIRIPAGRLDDWCQLWGEQYVPVLEANGQWLWGAWSGLTGQQDTISHQWAYTDLAHYQAMAAMRASDPRVAQSGALIEEGLLSSVMTPLPYHPPETPSGERGIVATARLFPTRANNAVEYARLMAEFVPRAEAQGAQLLGAFESFFGWNPRYMLHVWRYAGMEQYWASRRAVEADPECRRLLTAMRTLIPHERVELHTPTPYSRIQ